MVNFLKEFLMDAYTTMDNVVLESDVDNNCISLSYLNFNDIIRVSCDEDDVILISDFYQKKYTCGDSDVCIDAYVVNIINAYQHSTRTTQSSEKTQGDLYEDEIDDTIQDDEPNFSRLNIDRITSDLSTVVISKLVYEDNLIGYRFRLNNGCLDISIEKGKELGIVPYKIGKRVPLSATNGVLASKYECNHKVLFPDISNDDELCRKLLEALLS